MYVRQSSTYMCYSYDWSGDKWPHCALVALVSIYSGDVFINNILILLFYLITNWGMAIHESIIESQDHFNKL